MVFRVTSCAVLSFANQFFGYHQNTYIISYSPNCSTSISKACGSISTKKIHSHSRNKTFFSLIPGPFNLREHVLITIFANSGSNSVYAINIITIVKVFYHRGIHPLAAILLSHTTQVIYVYALLRLYDYTYWNCFIFFLNDLILWIIQLLGYGWAGLLRKYLIDSSYMWWPSNLVQVSLFRCH